MTKHNSDKDLNEMLKTMVTAVGTTSSSVEKTNHSVGKILNSVSELGKTVSEVVTKVDDITADVGDMKSEITQLKDHEEITTLQAAELRNAVSRKVYSLLSDDDAVIYGRKLFSDCWRFLGKYGCLRPYATTPKKDFDNIISGLKSYDPDLVMLKAEVDKSNLVMANYHDKLKENK